MEIRSQTPWREGVRSKGPLEAKRKELKSKLEDMEQQIDAKNSEIECIDRIMRLHAGKVKTGGNHYRTCRDKITRRQ